MSNIVFRMSFLNGDLRMKKNSTTNIQCLHGTPYGGISNIQCRSNNCVFANNSRLKKQSQLAGLCPEILNTKLEILNEFERVSLKKQSQCQNR